jgi:anti-sigma factor RsiW
MTAPFTPRSDEDEAQAITRLVDGTLGSTERQALEQWARERPDVQRRIAAQQRVVGELRAGGPAVPDGLVEHVRKRVEETSGSRSPRRRSRPDRSWSRWRPAIPVAAVAALAVALVIVISGGGSSGPSITAAARLAYVPATSPAPAARSATLLDVSYGGVIYPNYARQFNASPTGRLDNRIGGRQAVTVFYRLRNGARLSYTVFSGEPVPPPGAARVVGYDGVKLRVFNTGKLAVVTLVRHGRTCVLAAPTTNDIVLALAKAPIREQAA